MGITMAVEIAGVVVAIRVVVTRFRLLLTIQLRFPNTLAKHFKNQSSLELLWFFV